MFLISKSGTKRVCREHRIAFTGRKCPKCEAAKRSPYLNPTTLRTLTERGWTA